MFKNIMLPLDGSHFSELALPLALRVARNSGARLHLVRVHVPAVPTAEAAISSNYDELLRDWERDALDVALARVREAGVEATSELLDGPVVTALQHYIAAVTIDLVIMTTHGRSGIRRAVLGSTAEQCVRKTQVPILLLHPRDDTDDIVHVTDLKRMMVTLDGSPESEAVLPHAASLAQLTGAEIILTRVAVAPFEVAMTIGVEALRQYITDLRDQVEKYLKNVAARMPSDVRVSVVATDAERPVDGILKSARDQEADVIAMATHGRSGWVRVAVGSVAETVLHRSTTPVLLIKGATAPTSASQHSAQNARAHFGG